MLLSYLFFVSQTFGFFFLSESSVYAAKNASYEYITSLILSGCSTALADLGVLLRNHHVELAIMVLKRKLLPERKG